MVPSLDHAISESYVWAYPGCPTRILLSLKVVEQLQAEVSQSALGGGEIGGLLIRSKRSEQNIVRIVDFIPFPSEPKASEPRFKIPSESLAEAIARCPSEYKIVGYYRTDIDQTIHLRPDDLETIQQWFKDPANVFLVIAAGDSGRHTAGFFFWQNGSVAANAGLTFPFAATKLSSEGWPIEAEPPAKQTARRAGGLFGKIGDLVWGLSLPMKILIAVALFALVIGIRLVTWNRSERSLQPTAISMGLHVTRRGTKFLVTWNPHVPAIAQAREATLVIWDSSRLTWDGSNAPIYMTLPPGQLRLGSFTYTSFSFADKVKFRLDTVGATGEAASESLVSISPAPY